MMCAASVGRSGIEERAMVFSGIMRGAWPGQEGKASLNIGSPTHFRIVAAVRSVFQPTLSAQVMTFTMEM